MSEKKVTKIGILEQRESNRTYLKFLANFDDNSIESMDVTYVEMNKYNLATALREFADQIESSDI